MAMQYIHRVGRLVVLTLALLTVLTFGLTHRPLGHLAAPSAVTVASSSTTGAPDTGSGPPIA
ncbi:hypothetical protein [Sulfobacillus sp. hq2]|uniref:hypothetical protein n=1 Tax=Sulfobacillus TaxID=28033 RepID=UPI000CD22CD2|nr:hypothetical protein [Sulfobacillus sp. hq2]POB11749.1 hypothetical protein CO251_02790 [Sulfobacillus sp. hq2]